MIYQYYIYIFSIYSFVYRFAKLYSVNTAALISFDMRGMGIAIGLHEFSASLSYLVIITHIGASLYSRLKGEGIWNAMVPVWKEEGKVNSDLMTKLETVEEKAYDLIEKIFRLN